MVLDVFRALGRRWYVVAVGLLLTLLAALGTYQVSPPKYQAEALVLMLPAKSEVGKGGNPFLQLSGLEQPAGILAAYFSSAPTRADVERLSRTAQYEVAIDDSTRGPVLSVKVTDESAANAMQILTYLLQRIPDELARLQQEVDARGSAVVSSMPLTVDTEAKADLSDTIRAVIAVLVLGLVATGVAGFALDGALLRRSGVGAAERDEEEPDTEAAPRPAPVRPRPKPSPQPATRTGTGTKARPEADPPPATHEQRPSGWSWGGQEA